jgi:uncharacterized protein
MPAIISTELERPQSVFLTAAWRNLVMLNFSVDPDLLKPMVPAGTELDFFHGQAYVSIVGFQFLDAALLGVPIPFHRAFEEVNLRFYVVRHAPDGVRRGVVFIREIAPKWMVSTIARWVYNEKYVTMSMRHQVDHEAGHVKYEWWHRDRWNSVSARIHGSPTALISGSEEEFIAEHYWGYTMQRDGTTMEYAVEHPSWKVWQTSNANLDCDVSATYGDAFVPFLRGPASVLVADGSPVIVRRGRCLQHAHCLSRSSAHTG